MEEETKEVIGLFCQGLERYLSNEAVERFAHHLAHVSCEPWIVVEAAYAVNRTPDSILPGWVAVIERGEHAPKKLLGVRSGRLDFKLVRDDKHAVRLEFKIVHPWWRFEPELYKDLYESKGSENLRTDASICLVLNRPPASPVSWHPLHRKQEEARYLLERVAILGGDFPLKSSSGDTRVAKVVYSGQEREAIWLDWIAKWRLIALTHRDA